MIRSVITRPFSVRFTLKARPSLPDRRRTMNFLRCSVPKRRERVEMSMLVRAAMSPRRRSPFSHSAAITRHMGSVTPKGSISRAKASPILTPARFNKYGTKSASAKLFFISSAGKVAFPSPSRPAGQAMHRLRVPMAGRRRNRRSGKAASRCRRGS